MSDETYAVVDFETYRIGPRPGEYPPEPVGVALRWPNGKYEYLAWAHPAGDNNTTREEAIRAIRHAYKNTVIFHNAKFDMEVAWHHLGIEFPKRWHDTLLLGYLQSPDEPSFSLKPMSERLIGMPPVQQDAVRDWILANIKGATKKNFGAFIAFCPVALVGPYAISDVDRTWRLFKFFAPPVSANMPVAYNREKRLLPHLVSAERRGLRVDRLLLRMWQRDLTAALARCDELICVRLNDLNLNLDSDDALADALQREDLVTHWETPDGIPFPCGVPGVNTTASEELNPFADPNEIVVVTEAKPPTRSMSKGALKRCCIDKDLVGQLAYRTAAATMLRTFVEPWLIHSEKDGRLHTQWHQVRGVDKNGTRTGRIASSDPNLANVPNPNETPPPFGLPKLPSLRKALLPEEGCVWISLDYSQQELRITAHYEDGQMKMAYQRDPKLDLHAFAQELIRRMVNKVIPRKHIKNVAFASIYGAGIPKLARMMEVSEDEAEEVRDAYFAALPGLGQLIHNVKMVTRQRGFVISLGGRLMPVEPTKWVKGRERAYDYKQTNKLIQGSAADQTKEAIASFCESGGSGYFMLQVYDEINISVPKEHAEYWACVLRDCMLKALPLSVPVLVESKVGSTWGDLMPMVLP